MIKYSVLIIDDQEGWYEAISPILHDLECAAYHAGTVQAAYSEISKHHYDLIILDLRLAEDKEFNVQGLDILEKLSKDTSSPPVIIWTGHATPALRQKADWYKAFAFLEKVGSGKDFDHALFIQTVEKALAVQRN
jgi:DNA-binding NtrC family response regulator